MSVSIPLTPWGLAVLAALVMSAGCASPASAQTLTGLSQFSTDTSGNAAGGQHWTTNHLSSNFKLFLVRGSSPTGSFAPGQSSPTLDPPPGISESLSNGSHTFFIFGEPGASNGFSGLNLFFNNDASPGISVRGIDRTSSGSFTFFTANGGSTVDLLGNSVAGTGSLSTTVGGATITLTHYEWAVPESDVYGPDGLNRVWTEFHENPGIPDENENLGGRDFVGRFELFVSGAETNAVPEPGSMLLFLPALAAVAVLRRRRS